MADTTNGADPAPFGKVICNDCHVTVATVSLMDKAMVSMTVICPRCIQGAEIIIDDPDTMRSLEARAMTLDLNEIAFRLYTDLHSEDIDNE